MGYKMAHKWEHYTCSDESRNTTQSSSEKMFYLNGVERNIKVLYENHSFKIYLVADFISDEECYYMQREFEIGKKLEDVKPVPMEAVRKKTEINRRIHALLKNFNLRTLVPEEENFQFTQTESKDGTSDYSYLQSNSAKIIMNCNVPEKGGALTFKEVGVHVNTEKGSAILTAIQDKDNKYDEKLTTHRDCPIITGKKYVVSQTMKLK